MGNSRFKDSLKALEADIQYANMMALDYPRENDGARLQMRLYLCPRGHMFSFLLQWVDCRHAAALGFLKILIYFTYPDGTTTKMVYERKASIKEFYGVIFPSLLQLQSGIMGFEDRKQKEIRTRRYSKKDKWDVGKFSEFNLEREKECGICLEVSEQMVLPHCCHSLCLKCFRNWCRRSSCCPFCRGTLTRVQPPDLWVCIDTKDILDLPLITRENCARLFAYVEKLCIFDPDAVYCAV